MARTLGVLFLLAAAACSAGCDSEKPTVQPAPDRISPYRSTPPVDVPMADRSRNYRGGSCAHASLISLLRWQGRPQAADWWRRTFSGPAYVGLETSRTGHKTLIQCAQLAGMRYARTTSGDAGFLEWCSRTRRGAVVEFDYVFRGSVRRIGAHAVTFCGFVDGLAVILDNNRIDRLIRIPKLTFLTYWRKSGGDAFTVIYTPGPPKPF